MKNGLKLLLILVGILLVCVSVVLTLISPANVSIIGGAGWPTFWFFFQKYGWIVGAGLLLLLAGILLKKDQ